MTKTTGIKYRRNSNKASVYPPSQETMGLSELAEIPTNLGGPLNECENDPCATARCRPEVVADNRVVAEGEDG